jgi:hypothetical protein
LTEQDYAQAGYESALEVMSENMVAMSIAYHHSAQPRCASRQNVQSGEDISKG